MRKCTDTNGQRRKIQLMLDIERRSLDIQNFLERNVSQVQYFARSLTRFLQKQLEVQKLEQELQLIDADTIYVHIMTDHFEHRVCRIMKGNQPARHGTLRILFTDDGHIYAEINGIRIPLHIGIVQWVHTREHRYMITPFFSKDEAHRFKAKNIF